MAATSDPTLTHALIAKTLGVTVTTVKSYRRKFPEFWQVASHGKPIRFTPECLELCRRIRQHFKRGLSVEEARKRLAEEFPAAGPASPPPGEARPAALGPGSGRNDHLARIEGLMEGLFTLQNRTHSLLAELVSKLDVLAGQGVDHGARILSEQGTRARQAGATPSAKTAPQPVPSRSEGKTASTAPGGDMPSPATPDMPSPATPDLPSPATPDLPSPAMPDLPPPAMLELPVVIRTGDGEYLGVTSPSGKPFTLAQFEDFLSRRRPDGTAVSHWLRDGDEQWTLRLQADGTFHDHHFQKALTPRGNAVARFAFLSVDGARASEASLQAFLRQVKESFAR